MTVDNTTRGRQVGVQSGGAAKVLPDESKGGLVPHRPSGRPHAPGREDLNR
jgi:hypothetical protein